MNGLRKYIIIALFAISGVQLSYAQLVKIEGPELGQFEVLNSLSYKDQKGNIYFLKNNALTLSASIHKYNGIFWVNSKPLPNIQNTLNLVHYDNQTFFTGERNGATFVNHWDGNSGTWKTDSCTFSLRKNTDSSAVLVEHDGKLYFFGSGFGTIAGVNHSGSAYFENGVWNSTPRGYPDFVEMAVSAFDTMYILGRNKITSNDLIYKYVNDVVADSLPEGSLIFRSGDNILFKDGPLFIRSEGGNYINYTDSLKNYGVQEVYAGDEYNGRIILHANVAGIDGLINLSNKRFVPLGRNKGARIHSNQYGDFVAPLELPLNKFYSLGRIMWESALIEGQVYLDEKRNCVFEDEDIPLKNQVVFLDTFVTTTDENGIYRLFVPEGTSGILRIDTPKYYTNLCDTLTINPVKKDSIYFKNVAFQSPSPKLDVDLQLVGGLVRQGQRAYYKASIKNVGSIISESRNFTLEYDERLSDFQSALSHSIVDNKVDFTVPVLQVQERAEIEFSLYVTETLLNIGDTLFHFCSIDTFNDADTLNNRDTLVEEVLAAFDPNRKECYPNGVVTKPMDVMNYTIRFQNTGTDTAINIFVVDTLERHLPIRKVKVLNTSHWSSYQKEKIIGNTIVWEFKNIMLPDSSKNFKESQGFITFKVDLLKDLELGDSIKNRAHIYFDYQKPVTTNYAKVEKGIEEEEEMDSLDHGKHNILVYPNPVTNTIKVSNKREEAISFNLYDACGRLVYKNQVMPNEIKEMDLDEMSLGLYFMRYDNGYIGKLVKTQ